MASNPGPGNSGGSPPRWADVRATAEAALALPAEARGAFLDRVCRSDADLRAEVSTLVDACERAAQSPEFLAQPAAAFASAIITGSTDSAPRSAAGAREGTLGALWEGTLRRALAGRYELERELGRGGTATVYLARDIRHGRRVALKVLDPALGAAMSAERFLREIRVTAALTHPHILPLHDSGEADGLLYYVMPYVDGETLRDRLGREGALPVRDVVQLLRELADALAYAHGHGVVHRDIKPGNILLQGGHALLADFGIARALRRASEREEDGSTQSGGNGVGLAVSESGVAPTDESRTLTRGGLSPGTPAYMAPEQARAGAPIDHRTDLYALGVVGYEALAGAHPFGPRDQEGMIRAQLEEAPAPLMARRADVPSRLAALVMDLLAKDANDRPDSARVIQLALEERQLSTGRPARRRFILAGAAATVIVAASVGGYVMWRPQAAPTIGAQEGSAASPAPSLRNIAVLPFVNTGGQPNDDYFTDGLTDELAHALAGIPGLQLSGRTSSFAFKGKAVSAQEIGRTLGVGALVSGTVRHAGDRLRVTTQLVRTADGTVLWDGAYERRARDVFALQDAFTRAIIAALTPALGQDRAPAARQASEASLLDQRRGTQDQDAYDLYLKGRYYWLQRRNADGVLRAIDYFRQSIARNPSFARAHAGLAMAYQVLPVYLAVNGDSVLALAQASAERAAALDSMQSDAQLAIGEALETSGQLDAALVHFHRALALDSSSVTAYHWTATCLLSSGRTDEAIDMAQRAARLDPLARSVATAVSYALLFRRRFPEAIAAAHHAVALDSTFSLALDMLGLAQAFGGMPDSAVHTLEQGVRLDPRQPHLLADLVFAAAAAGRWNEARQVRLALSRPGGDRSNGTASAIAAMVFGDREPLLRELTTPAGQRRFFGTGDFLGCNPLLDPLWPEPRFRDAMRALGVQTCALARKWPVGPPPTA